MIKCDKVLILMDIVCSHNVLNLDLMFKDPGAQVECFWMLNGWLLLVKYSNLLSPRIILSSLNRINSVFLLFQHNIFVLSLLLKLKSHVLVIRSTPSADPHILGRIVSNPWDSRGKEKLRTSDRSAWHPVVVGSGCHECCPVLGPKCYNWRAVMCSFDASPSR